MSTAHLRNLLRKIMVLGQYWAVLFGTGSVSGWYWLIYDGTGSVQDSSGRYLVALGQYGAELADT